MAALLFFN